MFLHPYLHFPIPEETRRVAQTAFPKETLCLQMGDHLGTLYQDQQFAALTASGIGSAQDMRPTADEFHPSARRRAGAQLARTSGRNAAGDLEQSCGRCSRVDSERNPRGLVRMLRSTGRKRPFAQGRSGSSETGGDHRRGWAASAGRDQPWLVAVPAAQRLR